MSATGPTTPGETCEVGGCELPSRGVAFTNAGDDFRSCGTPNHGRDFRPDAERGGESDGQWLEGHHVVYLDHRFECTHCGARLLSLMQFQSRDCPAHTALNTAPEGEGR